MNKEKQINEITNELIFTNNYGTLDAVAKHLYESGYRKQEWISVDDRLPEDGQMVLIYDGRAYQWKPTVNCAIFQKGKTAAQLKEEGCRVISFADEYGNNKKPYRWRAVLGPMVWFGQMVTHWMPLPELPKMKGGVE